MLAPMRLPIVVACVLVVACGGPGKPTAVPTGGGSGGTAKAPHRIPQQTIEVHVVIAAKAILINGVELGGKPKVTDIEAIFGKPDRTWDTGGANKIHTWDKLGLLVYEPYDADGSGGDGRCISATFTFKPMSTSFTPSTNFGGTIELDGKLFSRALSLTTVLGWPGATQPYTKASIVFDREDFHVFTIEEHSGKHLDLVEISFWQKRDVEQPRKPQPRLTKVDEDNCKTSDVPHCSNRALAYQTGTAGRRNFERAFELARIACAGGDVFGCVMLGNMHDAGKGTALNKPEATTAWKRACTLGYKPACDLKSPLDDTSQRDGQ